MTGVKENLRDELEKTIPKENIKYDEPMSKHTSFKTGGNADYYITAKSEEDIIKVIDFAKKEEVPIYVMGNGSNLLVTDNGVRGIVLKIDLQGIEMQEMERICKKNNESTVKTTTEVLIKVKAGTKIMQLAQLLKQKGITGFEELSGIPGTIGGAIRMNAGAYGKEIKDIVIDTTCIDKNGNIFKLTNQEQEFGYRNSIFQKEKYIILETTLQLEKGAEKEIKDKMDKFIKERNEKQPIEYPSAGSTFKRGKGYITAKLIDEAGLKGYEIGGAQISEKHAGFIINKGNATSKDILDLIEYTKKIILEKFGIEIQEEIEIIGE